MTELKNEFSWSKSRDEVFKTCLRQYWYAYYAYWNGWLENASERVGELRSANPASSGGWEAQR